MSFCGNCRQPLSDPACASTEHKRIETDIALGLRRPDGRLTPRKRTSNHRSKQEIEVLRKTRKQYKQSFRPTKTSLDGPGQPYRRQRMK